ncbi:MAG: PepSY domain-containing protein [Pseudomonadota bacterium]
MKVSHAILAIAISASGFSAGAIASSDDREAVDRENWLTIPAIHDKVIAAGYSDINEIEREHDGYEVKARDEEGQRVKLYLDPLSGEVLKARSKDD